MDTSVTNNKLKSATRTTLIDTHIHTYIHTYVHMYVDRYVLYIHEQYCSIIELVPQPPPHSAGAILCGCAYSFLHTLVNALVLQGKIPPAQVAVGDDHHECKCSICAS